MNAPESIFESILTEDHLRQWVTERRPEDLYLEFKQKAGPTPGALDENDKRNFSKAMSSFANAAGGVLVFGVKTTLIEGADRATELKPIAGAERFSAALLDSVSTTTQPVVDGVRIDTISSSATGMGYVKCLVPASDRPPHRAMKYEERYWRRTSNGTLQMEHYELEDVFGRRLRPRLRVRVRLVLRPEPDPLEEVVFTYFNEGRGIARHAGFLCTFAEGQVVATNGLLRDETPRNGNQPTVSAYDPVGVVHANGLYSAQGAATLRRTTKGSPLLLSVKVYAEDMLTRDAGTVLTPGPEGHLL